jgi:methionyl-tRNA formyltransferase
MAKNQLTETSAYKIGVAGSTAHTVQCAEALWNHPHFSISWVLTPPPQPIGRKQELTKNPLHQWAEKNVIPVVFVEQKIRPELETEFPDKTDFLLVVDFGYLVPPWLLAFPKIAPVNIHPSKLPRWRGSSPGQFVMLHGEKTSTVTIMIMGEGLDTGPILWQDDFDVDPTWTQTEYYHHGFTLAAKQLPTTLTDLAKGTLVPTHQPDESPTPIAGRLKKEDGFIAWATVAEAAELTSSEVTFSTEKTSDLLETVRNATGENWATVLANASRALSPWPGLWTILPTTKGPKRLKLLQLKEDNGKLQLISVQLEGQKPAKWSEIKTLYSLSAGR